MLPGTAKLRMASDESCWSVMEARCVVVVGGAEGVETADDGNDGNAEEGAVDMGVMAVVITSEDGVVAPLDGDIMDAMAV